MRTEASFFFKLIPVFYAQLEELPTEFFATDSVEYKGNFLAFCLNELHYNSFDMSNLNDQVSVNIKNRVAKLIEMCTREFSFKLDKSDEQRVLDKSDRKLLDQVY